MQVFYHTDRDGHSSGALVSIATGLTDKKCFHEVDYTADLTKYPVEPGETIYFVDYSFSEHTKEMLDYFIESNCNIVWIDHHKSSIDFCKKHPEYASIDGIREIGKCGAYLTYEYFANECANRFDKQVPYFIELISDFDCWIQNDINSTYFELGISAIPNDALDPIWEQLFGGSNEMLNTIINHGQIIKDYVWKDNEVYCEKYGYETEIDGHKALVVNKRSNSWIFGDKINQYDLCCTWVFDGKQFNFSIFSEKKDVDCSKIAGKFGGGGHKGASGFTVKAKDPSKMPF